MGARQRAARLAAKAVLPVLVLAAVDSRAEQLLEKDGIVLAGTSRMVEFGAATCRVVEANHSEQVYEQIKGNEGQPLHLWELEFSVRNGSGKPLDHLIARYEVDSPWPPCTNWDGAAGARWADPAGHIQRSGGPVSVSVGETLSETIQVVAFHADTPGFSKWSVEYTFAADGAAGAASSVEPPQPRAAAREPSAPTARPAPVAVSRAPGGAFRDALRSGGDSPEMVVIPAGRFRMGCVSGLDCLDDEKPVHEVSIPQAFALSKREVTFSQWDACAAAGGCGGYRPDDRGWGRGNRPVIYVSWEDAQSYASWLSRETGEDYRLPSEAEWEYAARAGSATKYSWGNEIGSNRANCDGCGSQWDDEQTAPVGSFSPNAFGLYDMHGNVWEWVEDCWNASYSGAASNGTARRGGDCAKRVLRGGSWIYLPGSLRAALRSGDSAGIRFSILGFRVARTLTP